MGPLDALWHLGNLITPAVLTGLLSASLGKLVWRRELATVRWLRLAGPACAAAVLVTVAGLLVFGRDGKMATYGSMVAGCAVTLWWQGFGPGRR
jgi:ABC-type spermidine/putrescine transport system permease subunit I